MSDALTAVTNYLGGCSATAAQTVQPNMSYRREKSTDVGQVVQALSNGLRSEVEIAKTARLLLDRVQNALVVLVARGCVVESGGALFRLTDSGNDMVKEANAAERKHIALCARSAVMYASPQTTIIRRRKLPS
jgi:predicted transcriptional regulator